MFKWINAKTELPKDTDHIIMCTGDDQIYSGTGMVFNRNLKPRDAGLGFKSAYYTYWMLMPTPPAKP